MTFGPGSSPDPASQGWARTLYPGGDLEQDGEKLALSDGLTPALHRSKTGAVRWIGWPRALERKAAGVA